MQELIERLEKATGPDRKLDAAIEVAIMGGVIEHPDRWMAEKGYVFEGPQGYLPPVYTASIDAALTLVPEGWLWVVAREDDGAMARCVHNRNDEYLGWGQYENETVAGADTPAIALCIAAIKARAALTGI